MKKLFIVLFCVFGFIISYSQIKKPVECWNVTEEKTNLYFTNLFTNITGNDPNQTQIRLDFTEGKMIYVLGIQGVREYCKQKYNLPDSSVRKFANQFIRKGERIPLADTVLLRKLDNSHNKKLSLFADSVLNKYRSLGVREFMLKNCEGGVLKVNVDVTLLAYLFESKIFWENVTGKISSSALKQIEESCRIKWNNKTKKWILVK